MYKKHAKSPCCGAAVSRYGGRRRRCESCHRTFRIRRKKRGRKKKRFPKERIVKILLSGRPLAQTAYPHLPLSQRAKEKRFQQQLRKFTLRPKRQYVRGKRLTLILDGLWYIFKDGQWALYLMAIRSPQYQTASFLDPLFIPGKECFARWRLVMETIPKGLKRRIAAMVSDGFSGCEHLAEENNWVLQRCHLHLLLHLELVRGKRKKYWSPDHPREQIYQTIRQLITVKDKALLPGLINKIRTLTRSKECPNRLRFVANDTLRRLSEFRTYLEYPELQLPNTTNVIESMGSLIRKSTAKLNSPQSVILWAKAYIRAKKKLNCQRAKNQPN